MPEALFGWWILLCTAAAFNTVAWAWSARSLRGRRSEFSDAEFATRRALLWLAAAYAAGCAFRSVLPMVDVPRMCLHDTPLSRIFIGRAVATVAELCFVAQWALLLREAARAAGDHASATAARYMVPIIVVAEVSSWYAVLTTNNFFHALENALWTCTAGLAIATCIRLRSVVPAAARRALDGAIGAGALYLAFMLFYDVPMYVSRWLGDRAAGHEKLSLLDGVAETLQRCTVTRDWTAWQQDVTWLTLYFTLAVWMSLTLPHTPPFRQAASSDALRRV